MKVLVAGATGAIGIPLIKQLIENKHDVIGLARNDDSARKLQDQGVRAKVANALDRRAVNEAVKRCSPEVVINQLTSLPKRYDLAAMQEASAGDRKLRKKGGAFLQEAAVAAGVRRYILQSSAFWYEAGEGLADERCGFAVNASPYIAAGARFYFELERAALAVRGPELVMLRYAFLYGPGTWFARDGSVAEDVRASRYPVVGDGRAVWSWVHVDDAARAAVLALDRNAGIYNIADDNPSRSSTWLPAYARWLDAPPPPFITANLTGDEDSVHSATQLRGASNAKAKRQLTFQPRPLVWLPATANATSGAAD
jgi:nucleoside-diphosphate-sugar epimerase